MNQGRASSIFISFAQATLFILCLRTLPAHSMNSGRPQHLRHRSHAQIIEDISTGRVVINSGASKSSAKKSSVKNAEHVSIESWNGSPGRAPRAIVFVQPVPKEQKLDAEPSLAQIRQDPPTEPTSATAPKLKKLRRRNALSKSAVARALEPDNTPRKPSFLAQLCCCISARKAQVTAQ